jgi:hypothetical protein
LVELAAGLATRLCPAHRGELFARARALLADHPADYDRLWLEPLACLACAMPISAGTSCPRCSSSTLVQQALRLGAHPALEEETP